MTIVSVICATNREWIQTLFSVAHRAASKCIDFAMVYVKYEFRGCVTRAKRM